MIEMPMVSVIMLTYNHEKYIKEAVNGVMMQVCNFDFNLIIANDHSFDHTDKIIRDLLETHSFRDHVTYIYRDVNIGVSSNFLDVLQRCTGKYIAVCEGDDYWTDSSKLQKQVDFLEGNHDYSMVCHDALILNEKENDSRLFYRPHVKRHTFRTVDTLTNHFCPTASILFRKESLLSFAEINFIPFAGDHLLVQLLSLKGLIYRMSDVMSVYRKHPTGVSQIAKPLMKEVLINKINTLKYFNKISANKFQKNIWIEILLIRNSIRLLNAKSKFKIKYLTFYRRVLSKIRRLIIFNKYSESRT